MCIWSLGPLHFKGDSLLAIWPDEELLWGSYGLAAGSLSPCSVLQGTGQSGLCIPDFSRDFYWGALYKIPTFPKLPKALSLGIHLK